jgi:hypothetical protein
VFAYTVRVEVPSREIAEEFLVWLEERHLADVVRAGALHGEAILLDGDPIAIEVRYRFASRDAFAAYDAGPAVALRNEGRERFGPERGIRMTRSTGEVRSERP